MITIENTEVYGWKAAIRGMRNPMNSWDKSDTEYTYTEYIPSDRIDEDDVDDDGYFETYPLDCPEIGDNDLKLMKNLVSAGSDHRKFMRYITVTCDVVAPLYWWKEYDTYKVGTVANSTSTTHKIHAKEFTLDDFSYEHLDDLIIGGECKHNFIHVLNELIFELNLARTKFIETKDKAFWWQIIQLLPSSYNQRRTVLLNYEVLRNIYHARKAHKLDEWVNFCKWIESLPYSGLITDLWGENV